MEELIKTNQNSEITNIEEETGIVELTENLLMDARTEINNNNTISFPIAELSTLGTGVSSLIPAFNKVSQTITFPTDGLYKIANMGAGDALKIAKDGNAWGALKISEGKSKMAKLAQVNDLTAASEVVTAVNPAMIMVNAALYSNERQLSDIAETQKEILDLMIIEKESEVKADLSTLMKYINSYKNIWDNRMILEGYHKSVLDIQNRARKNLLSYQEQINNKINTKQLLIAPGKSISEYKDLENKFKYYRLSLYTFSLSSLLEVMLSENFKEAYINDLRNEISSLSSKYRNYFDKASLYLEKISKAEIGTHLVKGLGIAEKAVGDMIANIPLVKEGPVDEFLQKQGNDVKNSGVKMEKKAVMDFAALSNPYTGVFVDKMNELNLIYNHTSQICFDKENVYLLA